MDSTVFLLHFGSIVGSEETTTTCNNHGCTTGKLHQLSLLSSHDMGWLFPTSNLCKLIQINMARLWTS
uniref:Uncharacterized protein n=1 Tax=Arundo donax TaxID=35708 RepID=A0A0A9E449_ARUDO